MAASKPTSLLSEDVDTLSLSHLIGLWDLNHSLGCFPFGIPPYAEPPTPTIYVAKIFGVGQGTDPFRNRHPQSVALQSWPTPVRLD